MFVNAKNFHLSLLQSGIPLAPGFTVSQFTQNDCQREITFCKLDFSSDASAEAMRRLCSNKPLADVGVELLFLFIDAALISPY
jgi:hypothetical protein